MSDPIRHLSDALDAAAAAVDAVRDDQLAWPTPCTEWTVRGLVNHMVAENLSLATAAHGETPDVAVLFTHDYCCDGASEEYDRSAARAREALADEGLPQRRLRMPYGEVSGLEAVAVNVVEQLAHTWDLGAATGRRPDLPAAACEFALHVAAVFPAEFRQGPQPAFRAAVPAHPDLPAADRLAAYMGRELTFRPAALQAEPGPSGL